ncbi:MAG: IPTL-CTERM sorting domain-containing protein, partial [Burkholderiales bacterium]|nr:IPTL-CTERM sorting domain-containing protein [Burkholderiales bacterium]
HILGCAVLALGFFSALPAQAQTAVGTYTALQTAVANGDASIQLNANILDGATELTIVSDLVLDLNGYSLTIELDAPTGATSNGIKIDSGVTLTIMDSSPGANALTVTNGVDLANQPLNGSNPNCGAAINSSEGTLIINSGTVNATGGVYAASIGGGIYSNGGTVVINGGTVTAHGGGSAAGIGGAYQGDGGTITINGGTVDATGGLYGAGIGSSGGNSGIIMITGDAVVASSGGDGGAGIGGGSVNSISIDTTGTVTATGGTSGGSSGAAIGRRSNLGGAGISNVTHPTAANVTTPATASFNITVAAVGATPPTLAYQWEVSTGGAFTNVTDGTGGTTTGYTTAATTLAMSGYQYRNVITASNVNGDGTGTITYVTHPATLTVNAASVIASASIDVTAPATGAAPNATVTACGTDFVCSAVTWAPNDNPFQAGTQYTATITLTASAGYTFTGLAAATINGNAANVISNTGNTVTLSYQFMATSPLATRLTTSIPVLSPVGLVLLALALGGLAFRQGRRSA